MKKNLLFLSLLSLFALGACKKESIEEPTPTLDVEAKNSVLIAKHTWTGCGACGEYGFNYFESLMTNNPDDVHIAFTRGNLGNAGGYLNGPIYDFIRTNFEIPGSTPTFHYNLNPSLSLSQARAKMDSIGVIANANYEMKFENGKIILNTTTKFFQDVQGTYTIAPYLILDSIVAGQIGHPDGPNTEHHKVAIGIAKPVGAAEADFHGYTIAEGNIKNGYTVNLECEMDANSNWDQSKVSFAIMIFLNHGDGNYSLVNTFTK